MIQTDFVYSKFQ